MLLCIMKVNNFSYTAHFIIGCDMPFYHETCVLRMCYYGEVMLPMSVAQVQRTTAMGMYWLMADKKALYRP